MCLAGSLFPVMNGLAKLLAETYSFEQVVWARTLSHLILVLIVLVPKYGISIVFTNRPSLQLLMSFMLNFDFCFLCRYSIYFSCQSRFDYFYGAFDCCFVVKQIIR